MTRRFRCLMAAITVVGAAVRVWQLNLQALTLDELLMLPTANQYVRFGVPRPELPFHPNLRNVLLYVSGRVAGTSVMGLKGWSLVFGIFSVLMLGMLVWRLTHSETASLVAAALLAVDPLSVYMSRSGLQDGWTAFFALAGVHLAVSVMNSKRPSFAMWGSIACGVVFGLGVSAKFYPVPIEAATIAYLAWVFWRQGRRPLAVWAAGSILMSSVLVYLLTFVPWFSAGHSAGEWFAYVQALLQATATHSISLPDNVDTHAWQWFLRPFVVWQEMEYAVPLPRMGTAVANPITWLAVLVSAAAVWVTRRRQRGVAVLLGLFAASYLPLVVVSRPIWVLSAVSVVPFAFALVGVAVDEAGRRFGGWKTAVAYTLLATLLSAALFPGVTGHALDVSYLRKAVRRAAGTSVLLPPVEKQLQR